MGRGEKRNRSLLDLFTVRVLHLVISSHEEPSVFMTEANNFRIAYVLPDFTRFVSKPFRKPLNSETRCCQTNGDGLGRKTFVEK